MSVKKSNVTERDWHNAVQLYVRMFDEGEAPHTYRRGYVITRYGIVAIYEQTGKDVHRSRTSDSVRAIR